MDYLVSADSVEQVVAFYRARFGREPDGDAEWRWEGPSPGSGRTLRVGPPSPLPYALPPETRSSIISSYYSR